jgi:hypothetical protein
MFETPILFLIFNRPNTTEEVFERIRQIKPKYLFVAADGPRIHVEGEIELCNKTRAVINNIDWDCDLKLLFRKENLGCGKGPSNAINWFFNYVENGIILEDNCLPAVSFFDFCSILLEKYKDDQQIGLISGTIFYDKRISDKYNFFTGDFMYTWGFATWKRVWTEVDFSQKIDNKEAAKWLVERYDNNKLYVEYHLNILNNAEKEPIVYWNYSFFMHNIRKGRVGVIPTVNLVSNIGNSVTHFTSSKSLLLNTGIQEMKFGADFLQTGGTLTISQKKKIMTAIVQKIYPVGFKNKMHIQKRKVLGWLK